MKSFRAAIIWPYLTTNSLFVGSGETVNITSNLLEYDHVMIQTGGVLNITSSGLTVLAVKSSFVVDGVINAHTSSIGGPSSNITTPFGETINHTLTQSLGGSGGNGGTYLGGGFGGSGLNGFGGGGGGGVGGPLISGSNYQSNGGSGGSNGFLAYYSTTGGPNVGGTGMQTLADGGNGQNGMTSNTARGGAGGGSGGGAGRNATRWYGTGGGGGGNKGLHGATLVIYTQGNIEGTGQINVNGKNGFNGGNGGNMFTSSGGYFGDYAGSGGGGGGGAGGSGGNLYLRAAFLSNTLNLNYSGGLGGTAGISGTVLNSWRRGKNGQNGIPGQNGTMNFIDINSL